ncbi:MAG: hypothetical protein RJB31_2111 [Bacteroidota bacterium]
MFIKPSFKVVGHSNVNIVSVVAFYSVNSDFKRTQTFHASTNLPFGRQVLPAGRQVRHLGSGLQIYARKPNKMLFQHEFDAYIHADSDFFEVYLRQFFFDFIESRHSPDPDWGGWLRYAVPVDAEVCNMQGSPN